MGYELYWRKVGGETWHKLTSNSPITYSREITTPGIEGGQCPVFYRAVCWGLNYGVWQRLDQFLSGPLPGNYRTVPTGGTANGEPAYRREVLDAEGWKVISLFHMMYREAETWRITELIRLDGNPDNCGSPEGECKTDFFTAGGLITSVTEKSCVEISQKKPECECCTELLPKANALLMRLS